MMKSRPTPSHVEILLVDDDATDVRLTLEALKRSKLHAHVSTAEDGVEALEFLRRQGPYSDVPTPDLILLDVNMPRKNGLEALGEIKEDPELRHIPVIVLTTSDSEQDIYRAYYSHANCFVTKPIDMDQFRIIVNTIVHFWFTIVKLPARSEGAGRVEPCKFRCSTTNPSMPDCSI
jgi:two-component system, chemotaxis family, response regulator Rcp1